MSKVNECGPLSFWRHKEIYHPMKQKKREGATFQPHALAHRLDEFPVGYSLASCSPAELASASPTRTIVSSHVVQSKNYFAWSIVGS